MPPYHEYIFVVLDSTCGFFFFFCSDASLEITRKLKASAFLCVRNNESFWNRRFLTLSLALSLVELYSSRSPTPLAHLSPFFPLSSYDDGDVDV